MELFDSEILSNKDKNEKEETPENIHDEFMKLFDENEVLEIYKKYSNFDEKGCRLYNKNLTDKLQYSIFARKGKTEHEEGSVFDFYLLENRYDQLAAMVFTEETFKSEKEIYLNMNHRIINSKELGVSGSDFLKKAEDYFSILFKNGLMEKRKIGIYVSQLSVLQWALKNNFTLTAGSIEELAKYFENKDGELLKDQEGRLILNNEYSLIPLEDRHNKKDKNGEFFVKDDYIINKNFFTDSKFQNIREKYYGDGTGKNLNKKVLIYDGGRRGGNIVNDLTGLGLIMPRFTLEKEIK